MPEALPKLKVVMFMEDARWGASFASDTPKEDHGGTISTFCMVTANRVNSMAVPSRGSTSVPVKLRSAKWPESVLPTGGCGCLSIIWSRKWRRVPVTLILDMQLSKKLNNSLC